MYYTLIVRTKVMIFRVFSQIYLAYIIKSRLLLYFFTLLFAVFHFNLYICGAALHGELFT